MSKALEIIKRKANEFVSMSNDECVIITQNEVSTIKQELSRIKELEEELGFACGLTEKANDDWYKCETKLDAIREILQEFYSNQDIQSYFTIDKIKEVLEDEE